ncbi:hypothetical protein EDD36DRAFT_423386 [Exophiala viscosa]|uniref:Nephrocystin 3-like N-terminal domain-containing protein n=1 Tax=Exophiala viscosa TaxID=2486360 RepID=A0AAN6DM98_9EURO|nr:hypothetical protein EDD36DRAFT_423386 [Exophiala viscosa]
MLESATRPIPPILDDGITELWCPTDSKQIVADIYFVHGLKGHPLKTWRHSKASVVEKRMVTEPTSKKFKMSSILGRGRRHVHRGNSEDIPEARSLHNEAGCYWPLDLLPVDFDNVRVFTCGYNSNPTRGVAGGNQMNISQHARNLLQRIKNTRTDCMGRPIIFVAHSLGGILVKDAIIESAKYKHQPSLKDISDACTAIFFFGTPHRGSDAAKYGARMGMVLEILGFEVNKTILEALRREGEKLSAVERDFNDLLNEPVPPSEKIQICSFREGRSLTGLNYFPVGKVVDDSSSSFERRDIEQDFFIDANHMDMARFRSADMQGYVDFKTALTSYLQKVAAKSNEARKVVEEKQGHERVALLNTLDFEQRELRRYELSALETTDDTFRWIWTSPYRTWLENDELLFWISGKPASGKSTLMNYISRATETTDILEALNHKEWTIVHFFFDFRTGGSISNNMEGFLRCLLYQLCRDLPDLIKNLPHLRQFVRNPSLQSSTPATAQIPIHTLKEAVVKAVGDYSGSLLILLDGLDEYGETSTQPAMEQISEHRSRQKMTQQLQLVNFIKDQLGTRAKVCVASRPDPPFPDVFQGVPSFEMHDLNKKAIKEYGLLWLSKCFPYGQYEASALHDLCAKVAWLSSGVFLWAKFALEELAYGLSNGERLESDALEDRLEALPLELDDFYSTLFKGIPLEWTKTAGLILLLICYKEGRDDLTTDLLRMALHYLPASWPLRPDPATTSALADSDMFEKRLRAISRGTLEVSEATWEIQATGGIAKRCFPCRTVRLLHKTVWPYLEKRGWQEILGDTYSPTLAQETWIEVCTEAFLKGGLGSIRESAFAISDIWPREPQDDDSYGSTLAVPSVIGGHMSSLAMNSSSETMPLAHESLVRHALCNIPEYGRQYEMISRTSCLPLFSRLVNTNFAQVHWHEQCWCFSIPEFLEMQGTTLGLVHLAISHGQSIYVEDYLQQLIEVEAGALVDSGQRNLGAAFRASHQSVTANFDYQTKVLKELSIFLYCCCYEEPIGFPLGGMPRQLLEKCPVVNDYEIATAIWSTKSELLRMLLLYRKTPIRSLSIAPGRMELYLRYLRGLPKEMSGQLSPLCFLRHRGYDTGSVEKIIDMLKVRGVCMRDPCGPLGGPLHYVIEKGVLLDMYWDNVADVVATLIENGGELNQTGPNGTPLEYLWKVANTRSVHWEMVDVAGIRRTLRLLISSGATNSRQDPNGLVPSVVQMRLFGCNWDDYEECCRYYREGPREEGSIWSGPVPLNPTDAAQLNSRQREYNVDFHEAISEYKAAMGLEVVEDVCEEAGKDNEGTGVVENREGQDDEDAVEEDQDMYGGAL